MWQLKYSARVRQAASQASVIFSASSNSKESFNKYMSIDSPLLNETGCYVQEHPLIDKSQKETFDVLGRQTGLQKAVRYSFAERCYYG